MTNPTKPIDRVRYGSVQAAIWKNQDAEGRARYNATYERSYKDGDGNWQTTGSFSRDDSLVLAKVAEQAFARIHELQAKDREDAAKQATAAQGATR